jgi:hypothetical protein
MAPDSWVIDISAEETRDWRGGKELNLFAAVVSASKTWLAFVADDVRLDGYAVSHFQMFDRRMDCQYDSCRFVSKNVCIGNDHGPNAAGVPEVYI